MAGLDALTPMPPKVVRASTFTSRSGSRLTFQCEPLDSRAAELHYSSLPRTPLWASAFPHLRLGSRELARPSLSLLEATW
mmetsp:Transcript_119253/g.380148  ORF Transcript_119253/g.380148 Transcript_119253/m.380148 type:complete len:80 (+) Transcript_119253:296-535(+)